MIPIGAKVMNSETGEVICEVVSPIWPGEHIPVSSFGKFAPGEIPWRAGDRFDQRCCRPGPGGLGLALFVNGAWWPE